VSSKSEWFLKDHVTLKSNDVEKSVYNKKSLSFNVYNIISRESCWVWLRRSCKVYLCKDTFMMGLLSTMHCLLEILALSWAQILNRQQDIRVFESHFGQRDCNMRCVRLQKWETCHDRSTILIFSATFWVNWGEKTKSSFQHYIF